MANMKKSRAIQKRTLMLVQFSILLAIEAIFCFTILGSLPAIGPIVATLMMLPVVITSLLLGTKAGTVMGFFAGLFSFIVWTFTPPSPAAAFVFTPFYSFGDIQGNFGSILICFVPRILAGTFTGLNYKCMTKFFKKADIVNLCVSAIIGSLTNTILVLGGIWLFFSAEYSSLAGDVILAVIGSTVLFSGLPEAAVAGIVSPAVCKPVKTLLMKGN